MIEPVVSPDPAASVVVVRPGGASLEVLMVRRRDRGFFGSLVVFPGGGVDTVDRSPLAFGVVSGDAEDQAHRAAALRELAEETGLLITTRGVGLAPDLRDEDLYRALRSQGVSLAGDSLVLLSRWVTPIGAPRRFDARFYLLVVDDPPDVRLDTSELVEHAWTTPDEALARYSKGEWPMILPTLAHLRWLARRSSPADAVASARGADGRTLINPRVEPDGSLVRVYLPGEV
ncbi:MAG: NUDIX domain-containing protein [Acidimicrobiia bacterium]